MKNQKIKTNKILLICTSSQSVYNFRLGLLKKLKSDGYEVYILAFDNKYETELKNEGYDLISINDNNRCLNPLKILTLKNKYYKIIKEINPDIVFTFQLKPNIFGTLASKKAGIKNIYSMIEGAGDAFIYDSMKWKIIKKIECILYKKSLKYSKKIFFLNKDDKNEFIKLNIVNRDKCLIINGIGVDLSKFEYSPVNKKSNKFLMIARMLETKGIYDYCKCAEIVKHKNPKAEFLYLGAEGTVKKSDIQKYIDSGVIKYYGTKKDIRPYMKDSLCFVLPSLREGIPMTIMEAESIGRAIITTNNIGCKETVIDGYNGYLTDVHDYETMAQKCIYLLENKDKAVEFGINSRKYAEQFFDQEKINSLILKILKQS